MQNYGADTPFRTIDFSNESKWAIGQVFVSQPLSGQERSWKTLREIGPARGQVKVPRNLPVCLVVSFDGAENLNVLSKLGENDLQVLWFKGTNLQSKNFRQFANLHGLRVLDCSSTDVTSEALPIIASSFPQLEALDIARTIIDDSKISELAKLKKLTYLSLHHNNISDKAIRELASIKGLRNLNLRGTKITDASAAIIATLPNLEDLNILSTAISEVGFSNFAKLKHLKHMTVSEKRISSAAIAKLKRSLPACVVDARPDHHESKQKPI